MDNQLTLVTGGTGFLGSYLLRELVAKGCRVRALRRASSQMDLVRDVADRVEWAEGDVNDLWALEEALRGVTHVYHCAAMVSFHPRDVRNMMKINVEGTANIVNLCLETGVRKLVHVSSIAAVGRTKERPQLDETSKWVDGPLNTNYAISKHLSEMEVWRGHAEGLPVGIVNPAIILGAGRWHEGSARFFKQVFDGLKFCPVGRSGFVDVRDVARFMVSLMDSGISGQRYILSADSWSYRQFFDAVAASLQVPAPGIRVEPWLAEVAWRVEWLKEKLTGIQPMVTRESARTSVNSFFYGNEKSRSVFGFEYRPLAETIAEVGAQFLAAHRH
ncbi:MAG: NAD-dependent epimerase/dehydratase family protein [Saprospiraceae bacterium]